MLSYTPASCSVSSKLPSLWLLTLVAHSGCWLLQLRSPVESRRAPPRGVAREPVREAILLLLVAAGCMLLRSVRDPSKQWHSVNHLATHIPSVDRRSRVYGFPGLAPGAQHLAVSGPY